jgi:hypothetical protein
MRETIEINSGKNTTEVFMEKKEFEMKMETGGHQSHKQTAPPGLVWASVAGFASPSTDAFIYWKKPYSQGDFTRSRAPPTTHSSFLGAAGS